MSTKVTLSRIQVRIEMETQDISCGELQKRQAFVQKLCPPQGAACPSERKALKKLQKH